MLFSPSPTDEHCPKLWRSTSHSCTNVSIEIRENGIAYSLVFSKFVQYCELAPAGPSLLSSSIIMWFWLRVLCSIAVLWLPLNIFWRSDVLLETKRKSCENSLLSLEILSHHWTTAIHCHVLSELVCSGTRIHVCQVSTHTELTQIDLGVLLLTVLRGSCWFHTIDVGSLIHTIDYIWL